MLLMAKIWCSRAPADWGMLMYCKQHLSSLAIVIDKLQAVQLGTYVHPKEVWQGDVRALRRLSA
eukprot:COSAG04_NODE_26472_length_294_cov_1.051282_1_plen_63_part_10